MNEWVDFEESSALQGGSFDPREQTLTVKFKSLKSYRYFEVPPEYWSELCTASSKGWFFSKHIQNKFKFQQVGDHMSPEVRQGVDSLASPQTKDDARERLIKILEGSKDRQVVGSIDEVIEAAEAGEVRSQLGLGMAYLLGRWVIFDFTKSGYWFGRAANQGDTRGQLFYGMHLHSSGRPHWPEAYKWFLLASLGGMGRDHVDRLEKALSPDEIARGRDGAKLFRPISEDAAANPDEEPP
jgi:TPR repeat protein